MTADARDERNESLVEGRPIGPVRAWSRSHPVFFAAASGIFMLVYGLWLFGDLQAGVVGGLLTAAFIYTAWRPGGFGWKLDQWNVDQVAARGGSAVRWGWMLRASVIVILTSLALFAAVVLVGEAIG